MNRDLPHGMNDMFLQPGGLHFGAGATRLRTVLGSCVALVFWHPARCLGGMCHYMLPRRVDRQMGDLDGRYADEAVALLFRAMRAADTQPADYQVKMFGGANMFPGRRSAQDEHVGARNVDMALAIVGAHGLTSVGEHLGGAGHRNVIFDLWNGRVWLKHEPVRPPAAMLVAAGNGIAGGIACAA